MRFEVYGSSTDVDTYLCESLCQKLSRDTSERTNGETVIEVVFSSYLEIDYVRKMRELERQYGGALLTHKETHVVLRDGQYLGGVDRLKEVAVREFFVEDIEHFGNTIVLNRQSREDYQAALLKSGRPAVFLEFADGHKSKRGAAEDGSHAPQYGRIVIELFADRVPVACDNFTKLCTGELGATEEAKLHYVGCPIHRVVPGGWIQCGDIVGGTGASSLAAVGDNGRVADESFTCDFSDPVGGIVGYSTSEPHSIGSQFFITLGACAWMNGQFEGIGRVVQGFSVLRRMEAAELANQRPVRSIVIADSGKQEFK